jgi:hypothetical protein
MLLSQGLGPWHVHALVLHPRPALWPHALFRLQPAAAERALAGCQLVIVDGALKTLCVSEDATPLRMDNVLYSKGRRCQADFMVCYLGPVLHMGPVLHVLRH